MIESQFQTKFMHWFLADKFAPEVVFEPKVTKGNTFNLKQWRKKQPLQYLRLMDAATDVGVFWKISDTDPRVKPWDCFFVSNVPSFLVIWFDKQKRFFLIPVREIPDQVSVSYDYCLANWKPHKLTQIRKKYVIPLE
jgi:hypothetical protein